MAHRISKILLSIGCSALLFSGTAVAQEFGDEDLAEDEGMGEEGMAEPEGEAEPAAAAAAPVMAFAGWPQEIILRPNTLPKGAWAVGADLIATKSFELVGLFPAFGYGISDKLEIDIGYGFPLKTEDLMGDSEFFKIGDGTISVGVFFNVIRDGKLEVTPGGSIGYTVGPEGADGISPLVAGADIQYNLNDKMAIISPPQHLTITLDGDVKPVFLSLPVGFAFQATPMVYLEALTNIADIEISDYETQFIFADGLPLNLMAFYSPSNQMDIGVGFGIDLLPPDPTGVGDTLTWMAAFRYYGGVPVAGGAM